MHDYKKLGFKAGLEIHQQLDTTKLFSNSPSYLRNDEPDYTISRKLHAVAGESGEVDIATETEAQKDKTFYYQGYKDSISLVELDEEPPKPINQEALDVALQIALLLNCEIYPITQIMRKIVVDGSNTSGFQRTVLLAHDGFVETSLGKLPIDSICLEEDSARIVSRDDKSATYRLDRLGIPLVEIATSPNLTNPAQVKEAALKIGEILRACKVKRGIGTIRQDVNVSISGHPRVEIKGFQDPKMMIQTIDKEIERQQKNIKDKKTAGEVRNAEEDGTTKFLRPIPGKSRMYPETDLDLLRIPLERINKLKKNLPKLKSDIKSELKNKGLNDELIKLVLESQETLDEFQTLVEVYPKNADLVAKLISLWPNEIASKNNKSVKEIRSVLTERVLESILEKIKSKKIEEADAKHVLVNIANGQSVEQATKIDKIDSNELEAEIRAIVKSKPGLSANAYMGLVMAKLKGKINAKQAMDILNKIVN